ncbi:hypothetical protein Tco_0359933, partial [Tanacetum coccineum]
NGGVGYDDDDDGEVAVMVVLAAVGQQPERRGEGKARVEESEYDERVDRPRRNTFGFGRNARRKTFPAAATWWPAAGGEGWPAVGEGGERGEGL